MEDGEVKIPKEFYDYADRLYNTIDAFQNLDKSKSEVVEILAKFIYMKFISEQTYMDAIEYLTKELNLPIDVHLQFLANSFESTFVVFQHFDKRAGQAIAMAVANMLADYLHNESERTFTSKEKQPQRHNHNILDSMMYF